MSNFLNPDLSEFSPSEKLFSMYHFAFTQSRLLNVAAILELADHLANGEMAVEELALKTDTHAETLYRVLRTLSSLGIFSQATPRVFENNELSECLRKDVPDSQWAIIRQGEPGWPIYTGYTEIMRTLKTGETAIENYWGYDIWEHYKRNPEQRKVFNQSMLSYTAKQTKPITAAYQWGQFSNICDVGGGVGMQLESILEANSGCHGLVLDLPDVISDLIEHERLQGLEGDFFKSVPEDFDAYALRSILHDWDDESCIKILQTIRQSCTPETKILVVDMVLPDSDDFHFGKMIDIAMMLIAGGKERTESEFEALFARAEMKIEAIIPTSTHFSIIEASIA